MRGLLWSTWEDLGLLTSAFVLSWRLWLYLSPRTRPTQRHTDTASVAAYEQMFPGGTVDRSHWDHIEASARPHVFMCAVFSLCSLYVFGLKNTLGIDGVVFFSPSDCLFLHSSPLSRRCCESPALPVSSTPLTGELPADRQLWDRFHSHVFAPLFLLPPSLFPTLPSHFPWSSVLGFPHLQHIRVFTLQLYSRESS